MEHFHGQTDRKVQNRCSGASRFQQQAVNRRASDLHVVPIRPYFATSWNDASAPWRAGEFCKCLPPEAISEFESLAAPFCCEGTTVLFNEEQQPGSIMFLLEGRVKLSINSIDGRRLILGIAGPGEILGITSAISGCPYELTAEARFPCRIAALNRQSFLDFLLRYPLACQNVVRQLSLQYKRACEQLRIVGLTSPAPAKLARLLLDWCAEGEKTECGARIQLSLTHGEIGQHIGVSRETVSRTLNDFKNRELVEQRGSTLLVSNLRALEICAGAS